MKKRRVEKTKRTIQIVLEKISPERSRMSKALSIGYRVVAILSFLGYLFSKDPFYRTIDYIAFWGLLIVGSLFDLQENQ